MYSSLHTLKVFLWEDMCLMKPKERDSSPNSWEGDNPKDGRTGDGRTNPGADIELYLLKASELNSEWRCQGTTKEHLQDGFW